MDELYKYNYMYLLSVSLLITPAVYAAIEKVETYAEVICIQTYKGDWDAKIATFRKQEMNKKYYNDIASLEINM